MEIKSNEQVVIEKQEAPNSYEFGKAGNRFKIHFDTVTELKHRIDELIKEKLCLKEDAYKVEKEDIKTNGGI